MKKYAVCGLSNRAIGQFVLPLLGNPRLPEYGNFSRYGRIVAILDVDEGRVQAFNRSQETAIPFFGAHEFQKMIRETSPDVVVAAGPDGTHAEYIVAALRHQRDVITEKPIVIDVRQGWRVLQAEARSRGKVRVAHNDRYSPAHKQIKRMILSGALGRVTNIELVHNCDTYHGSSYFYRWNRDRSQSGGLTVSKGCHHFDLINWLIGDFPQQVFAYGALNYYGKNSPYNPDGKGKKKYSIAEIKKRCPYHQRWHARESTPPKDDHLNAYEAAFNLPFDVQYPSPTPMYIYDEDIRIEDTYSAVVRYRGGASMSYSCNFSSPWEGYRLAINGTRGRIETSKYTAPERCPFPVNEPQKIAYFPLFGDRQVTEVRSASGGHGGSDNALKWDLFAGVSRESRELGICADSRDGIYAVAVGEAIWRSIQKNGPVNIPDFDE